MDFTEQNPLELRRSNHGGYLFIDQGKPGEACSEIILRGFDESDVNVELLQEMVNRYNEHTELRLLMGQYFLANLNTKPENLEKLKKDFDGCDDPRAYEIHVASLRIGLKRLERKVEELIKRVG